MAPTSKPRVVSLIASSTEIVCALGFEKNLVGRSHECDFPLGVRSLPVLTAPKFDVGGASRDIDRRVKATLKDALSVYRVDEALLARLKPDVIITQSQCEVCAVSLADVEKAVCNTVGDACKVVALEPNALRDIWTDIRKTAKGLDAAARGEELIAGLKRRMDPIAQKSRALRPKPRVAMIEWIDPLMAAGNWVPELVKLAGGINLFGRAGKHSPWMTWGELRKNDPDIVVVIPCGFDITRTRGEMKTLVGKPGWRSLKAVREGKVFLADGNQYFNRPGPRVVDSLEILAEIFHPGSFRFGHESRGWERFSLRSWRSPDSGRKSRC